MPSINLIWKLLFFSPTTKLYHILVLKVSEKKGKKGAWDKVCTLSCTAQHSTLFFLYCKHYLGIINGVECCDLWSLLYTVSWYYLLIIFHALLFFIIKVGCIVHIFVAMNNRRYHSFRRPLDPLTNNAFFM